IFSRRRAISFTMAVVNFMTVLLYQKSCCRRNSGCPALLSRDRDSVRCFGAMGIDCLNFCGNATSELPNPRTELGGESGLSILSAAATLDSGAARVHRFLLRDASVKSKMDAYVWNHF